MNHESHALPPCWYIEYQNHGHITLRQDEADSAMANGAVQVTKYSHAELASQPQQDAASVERGRIVNRLREIAQFECACPEDAKLAVELADQIESEGARPAPLAVMPESITDAPAPD